MTEQAAGKSKAAQTDDDEGSSSLPNQSATSADERPGDADDAADDTSDETSDEADDTSGAAPDEGSDDPSDEKVDDKAGDKAGDTSGDTAGDTANGSPQPSAPVASPAAAFATTQRGGEAPERPNQRERLKAAGSTVKKGTDAIRNRIASIVWLIAVVCAVILALGALLYSLDANPDNSLVQWVNDTAKRLDGPFADVFSFEGKDARTKERLVNWGLAALAYLIAGRVADRIIRA